MNNKSAYRPERIRAAREQKGLTLDELGKKIGLSKGTLSRYESGIVSGVRKNTINDIALALDVNPKWLLGDTDDSVLTTKDREILISFGDLETALVDGSLGFCLATVATDELVREFVLELTKLDDEQRKLALKMIKALQ